MKEHVPEKKAITGSMTALVTPFRDDEVDWGCVDQLVDRQVEAGTDWLVPCGTTGESPTLTESERDRLVESVIARAKNRCGIMAGTGTNCTRETIRRTRRAAASGADAALVVVPYYNKPTSEGLFRHFAAVAESVDIPIVLYNVPPRTGVHLDNDTVARLRECYPNIAALKHATGCVEGVADLLCRCDIVVLSGDDPLTWPLMALGAVGVISVLSNLCPKLIKSLVVAARGGDIATAQALHRRVYLLASGIGRFGPNPVPIKTALAIMGLIREEFRLPLSTVDAGARAQIERILRRHEVLTGEAR